MSFCSFSEDRLTYGATCVDNLFFQEFLPRASGDAVRVYLYALYCSTHPGEEMSLEKLAAALDMDIAAVKGIFQYWERQGLVLRKSDNPPTYEYQDVRAALSSSAGEEKYYSLQRFNERLQAIFGPERLLHPQEFGKAAEWVEDLKLPEDVVLLMVKTCAQKRKTITFKYMDKIAATWSQAGVKTVEDARKLLTRETAPYKLAQQVLARFNLHRNPTDPEIELAKKWLEEDGATQEDVLAACQETVAGTNPSFRYVDSVLTRHMGGSVSRSIREDSDRRAAVMDVLRQLGLRTSPTPEQTAQYERYLSAGFEPEAILETARSVAQTGRTGFQALDATLTRCAEKGMFRLSDIQAYRDRKAEAEKTLSACGVNRTLTDAEIQLAEGWKQSYSPELIAAAAQRAVGVKNPLTYMDAVLKGWREKGVTSPEAALADRPAAAAASAANPVRDALNYEQRTYTEEQRRSRYVNLEDE